MSLYIGPDDTGDKVLHVTDGVTNEIDIKNGVLNSTVFHSDLPYLKWEEYVGATSTEVYLDSTFADDYDFTPGYYLRVAAPSGFLSAVDGSTTKYFVTINDVIVQRAVAHATSLFPWFSSVVSRPIGGSDYPSVSTPNTWMVSPGGGSYDIRFYVINVNADGYIPIEKTSSDITINGGISVNGIDLSTFKFLQSGSVNSMDKTINVNGGLPLQLVNHSAPSGAIQLQSNWEGTEISVGSKAIFSTYPNIPKVKYVSSESITTSFPYNKGPLHPYKTWGTYTRTATLFSGLKEGDMFMLEASDENLIVPGEVVGLSTLFTYKEGVIGEEKLLPRYFSYNGVLFIWDFYTTLRGNNGTIYADNITRSYHSAIGILNLTLFELHQTFKIHRFK